MNHVCRFRENSLSLMIFSFFLSSSSTLNRNFSASRYFARLAKTLSFFHQMETSFRLRRDFGQTLRPQRNQFFDASSSYLADSNANGEGNDRGVNHHRSDTCSKCSKMCIHRALPMRSVNGEMYCIHMTSLTIHIEEKKLSCRKWCTFTWSNVDPHRSERRTRSFLTNTLVRWNTTTLLVRSR